MSLPVSDIVDVTISVAAQSPTAPGFGTGLQLVRDGVLPSEERVRTYTSLTGVAADFATADEAYLAAQQYFGQSPAPEQINIGEWYESGAPAHLNGGTATTTIATYQAVTNGGFDITIDGTNEQIYGLDLHSVTTMAGMASALQAKLHAAAAGTTCVWDATNLRFVITSPTAGSSSEVAFPVAATGGSTPTDIRALFALTAATGADEIEVIETETVTEALNATVVYMATANLEAYAYGVDADATIAEQVEAAAWCEAQSPKRAFFYTYTAADALLSATTTDTFYLLDALAYTHSFGVYSASNAYASMSAMARALVVDYDQPNSAITLKFKQLPGTTADNITESQRAVLEGKNANYYTIFGDTAMLSQGVTASGRFFDEIMNLDWFESEIQIAAFTKLATATTKIAQTDGGVASIVQELDKVCVRAVNAGILAPGEWDGDDVGNVANGDLLPRGFYIYAQPVRDQSAADRAARECPPITIICTGAGAIHSISIGVTFQR